MKKLLLTLGKQKTARLGRINREEKNNQPGNWMREQLVKMIKMNQEIIYMSGGR